MLINTVPVIFCLICFTATAAKMSVHIDKCTISTVDDRQTCVYNAGDFLRLDCLHDTSDTDIMSITRYKDTSIVSVYDCYRCNSISVSQNFTEQQDGEKWNCSAQSPNKNENVTLFFKLRNGLSQMGLVSDKVADNTNYTVVWIAVGCCSLVSLLAVIAAVVTVKRVKAERKPVRKESGGPPVFSMYGTSSSNAENNYEYENIYDNPNDNERKLSMYTNTPSGT